MNTKCIIALTILISGCSSATYEEPDYENGKKLEKSAQIYILAPQNGSFEGKEYSESSMEVVEAIRSAVSEYSKTPIIVKDCKSISCVSNTSGESEIYYIVPEIIHWEDRATEWSGISDKIKIRLTVYNAKEKEISSTVFFGKSKWWTMGGDHPEDLLEKPINNYINTLYL